MGHDQEKALLFNDHLAAGGQGWKSLGDGDFEGSDDYSSSDNTSRSFEEYTDHKRRREQLIKYLGISIIILLGLFSAYALYFFARIIFTRHQGYNRAVFSPPFIPSPYDLEFRVPQFVRHSSKNSGGLKVSQTQLDRRWDSIGLERASLPCEWNEEEDSLLYSDLKNAGPYLIAINLYNNEAVVPTLARTLLATANYLGAANVFISIFESGSTDRTKVSLSHFARALSSLSIEHSIRSDARETDWSRVDRIAQLAVYRNIALEPLKDDHKTVVFLNDVFACPRDILELLRQKEMQKADAVCAMDWRGSRSWLKRVGLDGVKFYDNWTSRTIGGQTLRPRVDIFSELRNGITELFAADDAFQSLWKAKRPIPVYSCWNGMVVARAQPFRNGIQFRSAPLSSQECAASECKILAKDFWSQGANRWLIIPTVRVTYEQSIYTHPSLMALSRREETSENVELVDWSLTKPPSKVACYGLKRGLHLDLDVFEPKDLIA